MATLKFLDHKFMVMISIVLDVSRIKKRDLYLSRYYQEEMKKLFVFSKHLTILSKHITV